MNINISDLVPYEIALVRWRYDKAKKDIQRDKGFVGKVPVFELKGHWVMRNGTHHVRAALDSGVKTLLCEVVAPPGDRGAGHHVAAVTPELRAVANKLIVTMGQLQLALREELKKLPV